MTDKLTDAERARIAAYRDWLEKNITSRSERASEMEGFCTAVAWVRTAAAADIERAAAFIEMNIEEAVRQRDTSYKNSRQHYLDLYKNAAAARGAS